MIGTGRLIINGVWLDAEIEKMRKLIGKPLPQSEYERLTSRLDTLREIKDRRTEGYI